MSSAATSRLSLEPLGERFLFGWRGRPEKFRSVAAPAQRAESMRAAGLEQNFEFAARAIRRLADVGKLVGFAVDRDVGHVAGGAVKIPVELI